MFPALFLNVQGGWNAGFYLLMLCSLVGIGCRMKPMGKRFLQLLKEYWPVSLAMAGLFIAVLAGQIARGDFVAKTYHMPIRLACFPLLFWIMLSLSGKCLKNIQWGFGLGALLSAVAFYIETAAGTQRPLFMFDIPIIPFGHIAMLMGILAILSAGWHSSAEKITIAFKVLAGGAALYGSYLSQTRGGWVALPIFFAIAFVIFSNTTLRWRSSLVLVAAILCGGAYLSSPTVQNRVMAAQVDIAHYLEGKDKNTSVGLRLQLWRGSWILFKENPVFGVGREHYLEAAQQLVKRNIITPQAAQQVHSHNDLLFQMATLGLVGLTALLALYLVPAFYFVREIRSADRETRTIAGMGLAVTLGFLVFGLTDVMFYWKVSYTFYAIVQAVLFACLVKRNALLQQATEPQPVALQAGAVARISPTHTRVSPIWAPLQRTAHRLRKQIVTTD